MSALILAALRGRCRAGDNFWMTPATRWSLTLKTIICIILRRELIGAFAITDYPLVVAVIASGSYPDYEFGQTNYWCESLCTFYGWRNWRYCIAGDSSL